MVKYFLFKSSNKIDKNAFLEVLSSLGVDKAKVTFEDEKSGYIIEDKSFYSSLNTFVESFKVELGFDVFILMAHEINSVSRYTLNTLFSSFKNKVISLYQGAIYLIAHRDSKIASLIKDEFKYVDKELIDTVYAYINNDLNALVTSMALFIHRNTFNYRLERFVSLTHLDVRDFFNASYFLLFFNIKYLA